MEAGEAALLGLRRRSGDLEVGTRPGRRDSPDLTETATNGAGPRAELGVLGVGWRSPSMALLMRT